MRGGVSCYRHEGVIVRMEMGHKGLCPLCKAEERIGELEDEVRDLRRENDDLHGEVRVLQREVEATSTEETKGEA